LVSRHDPWLRSSDQECVQKSCRSQLGECALRSVLSARYRKFVPNLTRAWRISTLPAFWSCTVCAVPTRNIRFA
jgi:hypothetical protein